MFEGQSKHTLPWVEVCKAVEEYLNKRMLQPVSVSYHRSTPQGGLQVKIEAAAPFVPSDGIAAALAVAGTKPGAVVPIHEVERLAGHGTVMKKPRQ